MLLLVQSLNLAWKVRLFSLGHHGFFGLGAYAAAITTRLTMSDPGSWNLEEPLNRLAGLTLLAVCVLAGATLAACLARLLSSLFSRIRGDYFVVATLVFAEMVRSVAANWDYVGGGLGFEVPYLIFTKAGGERLIYGTFYAVLLLSLNLVVFVAIRRIGRSVYGLYIGAIADDPVAAELSGVDVIRLQSLMFVLAAAVAGGAGALFLHFTTLIAPSDFSFLNGLPIVLGVVLGGMRSARCVIAATCIYTFYEVIKLRFFGIFGPEYGELIADWKEALLGIFLILIVILPALMRQGWVRKLAREQKGSVANAW